MLFRSAGFGGVQKEKRGEVDGDKIAGLQCGRSKSILIRVTDTKERMHHPYLRAISRFHSTRVRGHYSHFRGESASHVPNAVLSTVFSTERAGLTLHFPHSLLTTSNLSRPLRTHAATWIAGRASSRAPTRTYSVM